MSEPQTEERRINRLKAKLLDLINNPVHLRVCVLGIVMAIGYFAVYNPMHAKIAEMTKWMEKDKKMIGLATGYEQMQKQYDEFKDRIPKNIDGKEWVQYMLDGIRKFPLKLSKLDCQPPRQVGPYTAIVMKLDMEGTYFEMDKFLRWIESNRRLLRVDDIIITPTRDDPNKVVFRMTILGLTG